MNKNPNISDGEYNRRARAFATAKDAWDAAVKAYGTSVRADACAARKKAWDSFEVADREWKEAIGYESLSDLRRKYGTGE